MKTTADINEKEAEAIKEKIVKVWEAFADSESFYKKPANIRISKFNDELRISLSAMYETPTFNAKHIIALTEAFETSNISTSNFAHEGCETCDYGSDYGIELIIKPDTNWSRIKQKVKEFLAKA